MHTIHACQSRVFEAPFGEVSICCERGEEDTAICALIFGGVDACRLLVERRTGDGAEFTSSAHDPLVRDGLERAWTALSAYFSSGEIDRTVPLCAGGSAFDRAVWAHLGSIERGRTQTYGQVARMLGKPRAAQAVGGACGRNPIAIFVPCHRVLDARGDLHGYAGGLERKRALLEIEGVWSGLSVGLPEAAA
jgi:O-6-methylguanine DNA methyltransferase